ncbi:alpha/beta hydrolase [Oxalobacteraceae bacterium]|nr:alpha/beta hydrolase [Oxalobacteraceae bacterium]
MKHSHRIYLGLALSLPVIVVLVVCAPLKVLNAMSSGAGSECSAGLAYGDGPRQLLDVYRPLNGDGKAPVVVFFYGGNWVSGERADYAFVGRALAARGIVAVVADYRLYPQVRYPEFLVDSARAVAWVSQHIGRYGGDPHKLFLMGHSAGAYNAAMLALDGKLLAQQGMDAAALRGWIGLAGPYDFIPIQNETTRPVFYYPQTPADSQPVNHVTRTAPPALLIAARKDSLVNPQRNTGGLAYRLRGKGVRVTEAYLEGVNHMTLVVSLAAPARWLAPTLDDVERFVKTDGGRLPDK